MSNQPSRNANNRSASSRNRTVLAKRSRRQRVPFVQRAAHSRANPPTSFTPPETWHEPTGRDDASYRIVLQSPGTGFRHVLSPSEIRQRLAEFPGWMLENLDVVQLSEMTRKKRRFPCYGMQWGTALYLYPVEEELVEYFSRPPKPALQIETRMYGGRWVEEQGGHWRLIWTPNAIRDFYLNNVLVHELGHLLDTRNSSYVDRERYAEWFALHHGYRSKNTKGLVHRTGKKGVRRRHHAQ